VYASVKSKKNKNESVITTEEFNFTTGVFFKEKPTFMTALELDSWSSAFLKRHCMYSTGDLFKWA